MGEFDLSSYAVKNCDVPQAYYIPEFISQDEEQYLLRHINDAPKPKWKKLENRRLQLWGGDLTPSNKLLAQALPPFLSKYPDIIGRLRSTGAFAKSKHGAPNHVIVNEYLPLQGIMPHEDGPSYHPVVATISLGSHTVFHYYRYKSESPSSTTPEANQPPDQIEVNEEPTGAVRDRKGRGRVIDLTRPVLSLLLEPRSLVITTRELYTDHLHGIDALAEDVFLPNSNSNPDPSSNSASASNSLHGDSESNVHHADHTHPIKQEEPHEEFIRESEVEIGVRVANWDMIEDASMREVATNGGLLERDIRVSLTCRDVENVVIVKSLR